MISLEPSWQSLANIAVDHINQSNIPNDIKSELGKIVLQMASVAHYARLHQLQQQYRDGEIEANEMPDWAKPLAGVSKELSHENR